MTTQLVAPGDQRLVNAARLRVRVPAGERGLVLLGEAPPRAWRV